MAANRIVVLERYVDISPFISQALAAADSDKDALGFLPSSVFMDMARREKLMIAVQVDSAGLAYVGHLLYETRPPRATVLQMYVSRDFRRQGAAAILLQRLKAHLTEHSFISIYASVAEDLVAANRFWQNQGFYIQRRRPGGKSRGRTILVRCHELDSPQLFEKSGISANNPLGLDVSLRGEKPIYLLDLNVLFDLGPRRIRKEQTLDIFRAERHGSCQLALSSELRDELARTTKAAPRSDPMHSWAAIFITFPVPSKLEAEQLLSELGKMVFPFKSNEGTLTANDCSDIKHLATAIYHRLTGFITNDSSILNAASLLGSRYGLQVISPTAFQDADRIQLQEESFETCTSDTLILNSLRTDDEIYVRGFLKSFDISDADILSSWAAVDSIENVCVRWAVWSDSAIVSYLACPSHVVGTTLTARIVVDEESIDAKGAVLLLLNRLITHVCQVAPALLRLEVPPRQVLVREVASILGFVRSDDGHVLSKLVFNRIITSSNWDQCGKDLFTACKLRLPSKIPAFKKFEPQIELTRADGNHVFIPLFELETQLAPALFCLPGRRAVITPIQSIFSDGLLAYSGQGTLLPRPRASTFAEKHYVSGARTLKLFMHGTLILFYESGRKNGVAAIVAIGRVQRAYLKPSDAIDRADLNPSILDSQTLEAIGKSRSKTVTVFDNLLILPQKVPLSFLKEIGCGDSYKLLSTQSITFEQLTKILSFGFRYVE